MSWGLIPFWAKDPKIGGRMINAHTKTVLKNVVKEWVVAASTGMDHHQIQERHTYRIMKASRQDSNRYNGGYQSSWALSPSEPGSVLINHPCPVVTIVGTTPQNSLN